MEKVKAEKILKAAFEKDHEVNIIEEKLTIDNYADRRNNLKGTKGYIQFYDLYVWKQIYK